MLFDTAYVSTPHVLMVQDVHVGPRASNCVMYLCAVYCVAIMPQYTTQEIALILHLLMFIHPD